ncbi:MAG: type II toxin-antitoxin system VapC family toxin [Synechococcus sp.]
MPAYAEAVFRQLQEQGADFLPISSWSVTELHSALGLKVRTKALSQAQAEVMLQAFERSLAPGLLVLELEPQDFRNANACLRGWNTSLRAADALHLAIASGRGATLCSLDAPFVAAAHSWAWKLSSWDRAASRSGIESCACGLLEKDWQ